MENWIEELKKKKNTYENQRILFIFSSTHTEYTRGWAIGMNIGLIQLRFDILTVIIVCFVIIEVSLIIYSTYFHRVEHSTAPVSVLLSISLSICSLSVSRLQKQNKKKQNNNLFLHPKDKTTSKYFWFVRNLKSKISHKSTEPKKEIQFLRVCEFLFDINALARITFH